MTLQPLSTVHATHAIHRGPNVVQNGWHGTVVNSWPSWLNTTYSVEFASQDVPGANVTISGLTEQDVQPD